MNKRHFLVMTALTTALLAACGVQPQLRTVALPNTATSGSENSGRFGIQAAGAWETTRLTAGYDDLTSSA